MLKAAAGCPGVVRPFGLFHMAMQPLRQILGFPELPHAVPGEATLDSYGPGESESDGTEPTPRICVLFMEKCDYSLQDRRMDKHGNAWRRVLVFLWGSTVGNRSRWFRYGRAPCLWRVCKSGHSWRFQTSRSLVSCGGTVWHSILFQNSQRVKSRSVWQAQYFCIVFRRRLSFCVAGAAL